ncbi:MAG: DUF5615 family PIN-like protein [Nitrospirota bacterium]
MAIGGKGPSPGVLMKFLIDMNLLPGWIDVLTAEGWEAVHWSTVGAHGATDESIMTWARDHVYMEATGTVPSTPPEIMCVFQGGSHCEKSRGNSRSVHDRI